ncbi:MAG: BatD family protein [Alistipes sp.]|nr:BatD family protein [Alistipes sp.]
MRFRILLVILFSLPLLAVGQQVQFEADVPTMVAMGNVFKVEFSVNTRPDRFVPPDLSAFSVVAGPTTSQGFSSHTINGVTTRSETFAYTYVLLADKPGTFTIPSAQIIVDGQQYSSKPVPYEVVEERGGGAGAQGGSQGGQAGRQPQGSTSQGSGDIAPEDLLVRAVVDKTNVYKGEPIRVYFKLYSRVQLANINRSKSPSFNGFWVQELGTDRYDWQNETYNGRVYQSRIILDYLLYPQQSNELTIDQLELNVYANIIEARASRSLMDDFFGGLPVVKQVEKKISTNPIRITVRDWPEGAPPSFSGAVGEFTMSAEFENSSFAVNSAANYIVRISGTGNLPLVQAPKLELPSSFEQYNVTTTESLNRSSNGINGYRQFEYPIIPRGEGEYYLEPAHFSFFNPRTGRYETLSSKEVLVRVQPDSTGGSSAYSGSGLVTGVSREELKLLDQDIRFIKLGSGHLTLSAGSFMGSTAYFVILILIFLCFAFALIYLQKRIKEMRNTEAVRGKRANKVALQRLKAAEGFMKEDNQRNFYEEMLKALWGYMGDKLNIPAAMLTKENVREELIKRGIQPEQVSHYIELIGSCEYAQYSPSGSGHMNDIYVNAVKAISKFESLIKKKRK